MPSPFFSILVPTYNQARFLPAALDSILAQTDPDWEAVVVNDGSTDATAVILAEYVRRDARFRAITKRNGGTASALNEGLRAARGEWICWLSSDDLFAVDKLAVHRDWILKNKECRFFFSHFRYLNDATGIVTEPDLWRDLPDQRWQVVEMLRANFIAGNSTCVARSAYERIGAFDGNTGYAQDYDMWLRLLAVYPGVFIPERTCTTRCHPGQDSAQRRDKCFFDAARSGMKFLETHGFEQWLPSLNLGDRTLTLEAVQRAFDVANSPHSAIYGLGVHPGLIARVLEWAWSPRQDASVRKYCLQRLRVSAAGHCGTRLGMIFEAGVAAVCIPEIRFGPISLPCRVTAQMTFWEWRRCGNPRSESLKQYGAESGWDLTEPVGGQGADKRVVMVTDSVIADAIPYGALKMTLEMTLQMARAGYRPLLVGIGTSGMEWPCGIPAISVPSDIDLLRALRSLRPVDFLISAARGDALAYGRARVGLVYQHNPSEMLGLSRRWHRLLQPRVITVSQYAKTLMEDSGCDTNSVRVVPNGYDHAVFTPAQGDGTRLDRSLIFAGNLHHYKGIDVALKAFAMVRRVYPEAMFSVFGLAAGGWPSGLVDCMESAWLDSERRIRWDIMERDIPGVHFGGSVKPSVLAAEFRRHSVLIMPSRIGETFGMVSVEAQACGCIPVLPRNGGFPETMREGRTGYLYEPNTPEQLAATILGLWNKGEPGDDMRNAAVKFVSSTFSYDRSGREFCSALNQIHAWSLWQRFILGALRANRAMTWTLRRMLRPTTSACRRNPAAT